MIIYNKVMMYLDQGYQDENVRIFVGEAGITCVFLTGGQGVVAIGGNYTYFKRVLKNLETIYE